MLYFLGEPKLMTDRRPYKADQSRHQGDEKHKPQMASGPCRFRTTLRGKPTPEGKAEENTCHHEYYEPTHNPVSCFDVVGGVPI
jgi:hypothetical protein